LGRTIAVFLGGVALTAIVGTLLSTAFTPDAGKLVVWMLHQRPNDPNWLEVYPRWHRWMLISAYVVPPLTGAVVGLFVGLLQKKAAALVAAACFLPELVLMSIGSTWVWAGSLSGTLRYWAIRSIPFVTAAAVAAIVQRLVRRRREDSSSVGPSYA
jgi:hypothetical protein